LRCVGAVADGTKSYALTRRRVFVPRTGPEIIRLSRMVQLSGLLLPGADLAAAQPLAKKETAPATLRAYKADWTHFAQWCAEHGFVAVPIAPASVGGGSETAPYSRSGELSGVAPKIGGSRLERFGDEADDLVSRLARHHRCHHRQEQGDHCRQVC
jgi:hypothetical protein